MEGDVYNEGVLQYPLGTSKYTTTTPEYNDILMKLMNRITLTDIPGIKEGMINLIFRYDDDLKYLIDYYRKTGKTTIDNDKEALDELTVKIEKYYEDTNAEVPKWKENNYIEYVQAKKNSPVYIKARRAGIGNMYRKIVAICEDLDAGEFSRVDYKVAPCKFEHSTGLPMGFYDLSILIEYMSGIDNRNVRHALNIDFIIKPKLRLTNFVEVVRMYRVLGNTTPSYTSNVITESMVVVACKTIPDDYEQRSIIDLLETQGIGVIEME